MGEIRVGDRVSIADTPAEVQDFIKSCLDRHGDHLPEVQLYYTYDGAIFCPIDSPFPYSGIKDIEKNCPKGLFKGHAATMIRTNAGTLVVPDERYQFWKPLSAGMSRCGENLVHTARRKLEEEAFIFSLDHKIRIIPRAAPIAPPESQHCSLGFPVGSIASSGIVSHIGYAINAQIGFFEAVYEWYLGNINGISVWPQEDWFAGGSAGMSAYTAARSVDRKFDITGIFSGQQGFLPGEIVLEGFGLHPTLEKFL